ncbi:MAG TPA: adenylate/guanylate cyclase domain-containing protein [Methylomirabilota bacterium]|nr:adenylate/guanylate cyclase domain-containing protein [Methylomirabilota bacterium]
MAILAGLLGALIVFYGLGYALFRKDYPMFRFLTPAAFFYIIAVIALLLCYELAIRYLIGRWLRRGRGVPGALRYLNAFVETSVPSILMLLVSREMNPVYVLQSAAGLLYAVFIVLSTLRLDFRLSVFTGLVAAAEYVALSFAYIGAGGGVVEGGARAAAGTPFEAPPFYVAKGVMLALAGLAAGFVADQLKRRVSNVFRAQEERQRIVSTFGQQVSPAIVEALLKAGPEIASRRTFVCVMFMDIRNFTPLVENKSPEEIVAFQNVVFAEAVDVVNRNHGIINQFLGDGFMATFGAPLATGRDCGNALAAARELVAGIRELSEAGRIPPIMIGVGLHAGEAVSGNVGSALRKQYSITGNVVILASRIEQLNKGYGSQILVSGEVLAAAGEQALGHEPLGPVHVKGREEPIEIYRLA